MYVYIYVCTVRISIDLYTTILHAPSLTRDLITYLLVIGILDIVSSDIISIQEIPIAGKTNDGNTKKRIAHRLYIIQSVCQSVTIFCPSSS